MVDAEKADTVAEPAAANKGSSTGAAAAAASSTSSKPAASSSKKKGKAKVEVPDEVDPDLPGQKYRVGELIYANYMNGKQWFEAKVLKVEKRKERIFYYVHYQGWSDKFNDWRPYHDDDELHKHDEEGKRIYQEAKIKLKAEKEKGKAKPAPPPEVEDKKKGRRGVREGDDTLDDEVSVGSGHGEVKLKISGFLKKQLITDWESVTRQHRLVTLPRPMTVRALLAEYESTKVKQESSLQMCKEIVNGVEQYFERALGTVLLYRFERPQYKMMQQKNPGKPMSHIYGAEHLLRLFVKLPSLLAYTKLEPKEAVVMGSKLNDLLTWLNKKAQQSPLFQVEYEATDKEYQQMVNSQEQH